MSKREKKLSPEEWQARYDAACAIVAPEILRHVRVLARLPVQAVPQRQALQRRPGLLSAEPLASVPYDVGVAAQIRMLAETAAERRPLSRNAHNRQAHNSLCLHDPKNQKRRAKTEAKSQARPQAKAASRRADLDRDGAARWK